MLTTANLIADDDRLYRALMERDPAFDGHAYVCVTTTRIFCRLTCPARKPLRSNVLFHATIAACIESGFRPCLRCRPLEAVKRREPVVADLLDRLPPGALDARGWAAYKVAWVAGCVLFRADALRDVGGFGFWADLPPNLRGEDVVTQLQVAETAGGAGLLPSGAWHLELPTSIEDRSVDAYAAVLEG